MLNADRLIPGFLILIFSFFFYFFESFDSFFIITIILLVTYELFINKIFNFDSFYNNFFIFFFGILIFFIDDFGIEKYLVGVFILLVLLSVVFNKLRNDCFNLTVIFFLYFLFEILSLDRLLFFKLIFISFFNDTSAFFFGKILKGPKIIKSISPNKTWSGTLISFFLSFIVLIYLNFDCFTSFLISISLFFGDLYLSLIKRSNHIKDFSQIFRGHGGILDRIDSVFFSSSIAYLMLI